MHFTLNKNEKGGKVKSNFKGNGQKDIKLII